LRVRASDREAVRPPASVYVGVREQGGRQHVSVSVYVGVSK
jgi:hypothetical protein